VAQFVSHQAGSGWRLTNSTFPCKTTFDFADKKQPANSTFQEKWHVMKVAWFSFKTGLKLLEPLIQFKK
jgi:hypothetical protein